MKTVLIGLIVAAAVGAGVLHAGRSTADTSVAGKWRMAVDSPHGAVDMGMTLSQDGNKVTGTFASPHGDMPVQGEFTDGTLKLSTTSQEAAKTFNAKLKDDDTLAGYISSSMGDMTFTAKRVADK
jgi:hypothetical protein